MENNCPGTMSNQLVVGPSMEIVAANTCDCNLERIVPLVLRPNHVRRNLRVVEFERNNSSS